MLDAIRRRRKTVEPRPLHLVEEQRKSYFNLHQYFAQARHFHVNVRSSVEANDGITISSLFSHSLQD